MTMSCMSQTRGRWDNGKRKKQMIRYSPKITNEGVLGDVTPVTDLDTVVNAYHKNQSPDQASKVNHVWQKGAGVTGGEWTSGEDGEGEEKRENVCFRYGCLNLIIWVSLCNNNHSVAVVLRDFNERNKWVTTLLLMREQSDAYVTMVTAKTKNDDDDNDGDDDVSVSKTIS